MRAKLPRCDLGAIPLQVNACGDHLPFQTRSEVELRAPAVDHDPHLDTPTRRALECRRDLPAGCVIGENVGLEPDLALRGIDRALQRREVLGPVAQQRELVSGLVAIHVELPPPYRVLTLEIESCR